MNTLQKRTCLRYIKKALRLHPNLLNESRMRIHKGSLIVDVRVPGDDGTIVAKFEAMIEHQRTVKERLRHALQQSFITPTTELGLLAAQYIWMTDRVWTYHAFEDWVIRWNRLTLTWLHHIPVNSAVPDTSEIREKLRTQTTALLHLFSHHPTDDDYPTQLLGEIEHHRAKTAAMAKLLVTIGTGNEGWMRHVPDFMLADLDIVEWPVYLWLTMSPNTRGKFLRYLKRQGMQPSTTLWNRTYRLVNEALKKQVTTSEGNYKILEFPTLSISSVGMYFDAWFRLEVMTFVTNHCQGAYNDLIKKRKDCGDRIESTTKQVLETLSGPTPPYLRWSKDNTPVKHTNFSDSIKGFFSSLGRADPAAGTAWIEANIRQWFMDTFCGENFNDWFSISTNTGADGNVSMTLVGNEGITVEDGLICKA